MSWVRIDDQFADHPKVVTAGPEAAWLDVCGMCYCQRYLTDGFVPEGVLPRLVPWPEAKVKQLLERLLEVCLWEARPGGYYIHDFLKYNPSRAEVEAKRNARQTAGKVGGKRAAQAKAQANAKQMLEQISSKVQPPTPTPTPIITQSANADCGHAPDKPAVRKREPKPEPPAAVKAYREIARRYPDQSQYEIIDQAVGRDPPALDFWRKVVTAYIGCGWNKLNITTMIEFFKRHEIPGENVREAHGPNRGNGRTDQGKRGTQSTTGLDPETERWLDANDPGTMARLRGDNGDAPAGKAAGGGILERGATRLDPGG